MQPRRAYFVYIMTNRSQTLYIGVTNDIARRVLGHRSRIPGTFTGRYHLDRLVYVEETNDVVAAIEREKQLKGWTRKKKMDLISSVNPRWEDLSEGWFEDAAISSGRPS
jgi:putative endonuclease